MSFEPEPGARIKLNHEEIEFLALEAGGAASVFVYAESGKEGTVYKVLKNSETYALKVFYPEYRDKRLLENTDKLSRFKHLDGFRVAERTVLTQANFPDVIRKFPDLNYAVLMPWVEGALWGNLMLNGEDPLPQETYFKIGQAFAQVINKLEAQGLAHCDLSNNNFIIGKDYTSIQLIDIEDMYAPDMPKPIPTVSFGTVGYRNKWIAENGLWGPESDRFSFAVLCAEIFTWHKAEIRDKRAGSASFFDESEIGERSERYELMSGYLGDLNRELPTLFERTWTAVSPQECPSVTEWTNVIRQIGNSAVTISVPSAVIPSTPLDEAAAVGTDEPIATETLPAVAEEKPNAEPQAVETEAGLNEDKSEAATLDPQPVQESLPSAGEQPQPISASKDTTAEFRPIFNLPYAMDNPEPETRVISRPTTSPTPEALAPETPKAEPDTITLIRGVPAKMELNLELLEFGTLAKSPVVLELVIANTGGNILSGTLTGETWLKISETTFNLMPGDKCTIALAPNLSELPTPKSGNEYRTATALTIESNSGAEVLAASYRLPKQSNLKLILGLLTTAGCAVLALIVVIIIIVVLANM